MSLSEKNRPRHFFILGAAKCGTTSLHDYLNQHPDICMSNPKEPRFFESDYEKGLDHYWKACFAHWKGEPWVGEARHRNLYLPYVPERIAASYPDARMLVIVRNPVDRSFSHYWHHKVLGLEHLSFEAAIDADLERIARGDTVVTEEQREKYVKHLARWGVNPYYTTYVDTGYYAEQIERYFQYFDRSAVKIVFLEDFEASPQDVYQEILNFLDERLQPFRVDFPVKNKRVSRVFRFELLRRIASIVPRPIKESIKKTLLRVEDQTFDDRKMSPQMRARLIEHFKEPNRRLEKLTGRDLSRWNH